MTGAILSRMMSFLVKIARNEGASVTFDAATEVNKLSSAARG